MQLDANDLQEAVALCDAEGIILEWNRAATEVTGFRAEEVIGYHLDAVLAPSSQETVHDLFNAERTGSVLPGIAVRLQTNYGMEVPAEVTTAPQFSEGKLHGWVLIFRDTTLRVMLREELDRMETLYRGLVERSPDIIYVLDVQGKVLFINDTVETLLGYSKKDLLGRELIDIVHPADRDRAYWPLRERRRADRATRSLRLRMITGAGAPRRYDLDFLYISLDSVGLADPRPALQNGLAAEGLGTQGVARDITDLVMLQEFAGQVDLILPICAICRKIRVESGREEQWLPLSEYLGIKTGILFSHTYCPDHMPRAE